MDAQKYQSWDNPRCEILKALYKNRPMSRKICLICKGGRLLCGRDSCPLLRKINIQSPIEKNLSENIFGKSPSIFVGWKNYPDVFIGPLTSLSEEKIDIIDDPAKWYGIGFNDIIGLRSMLVRASSRHNIYEQADFIEKNKEIALSVKPIDIEARFKSKPKFKISFSPVSQPMGPAGELKNFTLAENPKIPKKVDSVTEDNLSASESLFTLFKEENFDVYYLTKAFSSGAFGKNERRKIVPTRWSITATDDILGKFLIKEIKEYEPLKEINVFSNTYLFNHFEILLLPGNWEFEQFEAWAPNTLWTMSYKEYAINTESEYNKGRNDYAIKEGGGYYASRFAALEHLSKIKSQARVIIFREIYEGYVMPVGVWEVRENVRHAFLNLPKKFGALKDALDEIKKNLMIPIGEYIKRSELLRQKKLTKF